MADIIRFDQGYHYDDGNCYDLPPLFPLPKLKALKHMAGDFIPKTKGDYRAWLLNLKNQITTQGPLFTLAAGEVTATTAACTAQIALADAAVAAAAALKSALQAEADGKKTTDALLRHKISAWKQMPGFTPAIAQELRVIGSAAAFDPGAYKPEFKVKITGGEIRLDWVKKGADAVHIYGRLRGQPGWTLLGMDTSSPYIDGRPLVQANVAEVREYMLRGVLTDVEIGLDSDIQSITWGGA
jgi:hypothetical protein